MYILDKVIDKLIQVKWNKLKSKYKSVMWIKTNCVSLEGTSVVPHGYKLGATKRMRMVERAQYLCDVILAHYPPKDTETLVIRRDMLGVAQDENENFWVSARVGAV